MASNASNLLAVASNLVAMIASNSDCLQPTSSDGLQPSIAMDSLQPNSDGPQPKILVVMASNLVVVASNLRASDMGVNSVQVSHVILL